jgi:hypothetical protein
MEWAGMSGRADAAFIEYLDALIAIQGQSPAGIAHDQ